MNAREWDLIMMEVDMEWEELMRTFEEEWQGERLRMKNEVENGTIPETTEPLLGQEGTELP